MDGRIDGLMGWWVWTDMWVDRWVDVDRQKPDQVFMFLYQPATL